MGVVGADGSAASMTGGLCMAETRSLVANHPSWEIIVRSFADKGLMVLPPGTSIDAMLGKE